MSRPLRRSKSLATAAIRILALSVLGASCVTLRVSDAEADETCCTAGTVETIDWCCSADCKFSCCAWGQDKWRLICRDDCYRPKTLYAWSGTQRTYVNGTEKTPLVTDRPDFTEASSTVGLGRVQIEMGYTYIRDNNEAIFRSAHSFPETLLRVGMFAEWFEVRVAWNYGVNLNRENVVSNIFEGGDDLYLGAKFALTEQDGWLPEMVILPQMNVPTGHESVTSGEVEPGVNWLYSWEINDWLSTGGSTQVNRAQDEAGVWFAEWAQSWTFAYTLNEKLGAYTEWFAFFPAGSVQDLPQQYFNGGFVYLVNTNFQLDIRAGVGLSDAADDFFAGAGAVLRF